MSIKAFPLNQKEYSYNAQDVMKYYAGRNSGVFETGDNLKVSANGGLELRINTGMGWLAKDYVASVAFWNESVEYRMVEAGHDTYDRIDLVVVSWNFIQQEQNPKLIIRKGTPSSSPVIPSLVNDSSTIEIALARINVRKGAITLSNSNIVDLRGNDTYCPMVYDEQTIREGFRGCVGYADGVNKISDFPNATPASNDKILFEQNGEGKNTTISNAVNTCSLTLEEIEASTDLSGKIASANALLNSREIKLLGTLTTYDTKYILAENLNNFRLIMGTLIFKQYSLATTITTPSLLIGGEMIVCFYDGTLRKGQFFVDNAITVTTSGNPENWTGISKILLYGVR